jgi:hypothetical protein
MPGKLDECTFQHDVRNMLLLIHTSMDLTIRYELTRGLFQLIGNHLEFVERNTILFKQVVVEKIEDWARCSPESDERKIAEEFGWIRTTLLVK